MAVAYAPAAEQQLKEEDPRFLITAVPRVEPDEQALEDMAGMKDENDAYGYESVSDEQELDDVDPRDGINEEEFQAQESAERLQSQLARDDAEATREAVVAAAAARDEEGNVPVEERTTLTPLQVEKDVQPMRKAIVLGGYINPEGSPVARPEDPPAAKGPLVDI